jgi:hypothetical protein
VVEGAHGRHGGVEQALAWQHALAAGQCHGGAFHHRHAAFGQLQLQQRDRPVVAAHEVESGLQLSSGGSGHSGLSVGCR